LVVIGAGYIACEFRVDLNGLGAQVTLMQRKTHILSEFDEDARQFLAAEMKEGRCRHSLQRAGQRDPSRQ